VINQAEFGTKDSTQILSQMKKKAFLGEKSLDITSPLW
jgi:hypothetical protein